jgi:hypothetical protein
MISDPAAGGMVRLFVDILSQLIPEDAKKSGLRCREKVLPYAASCIEIMVIGDFLLIFLPKTPFAFYFHST